jgi:subtilisin-like proprotein convertase family protein
MFMKSTILKPIVKPVALALLLSGLPAFGQVILTSSWTGAREIPDDDPSGVAYNFSLNDPATVIQNVEVTLNFSGGYNGDLYASLSQQGAGGGFSVLLNRVGVTAGNPDGYRDTGFSVTLSGSALKDIHNYQNLSPSYNGSGQLTGAYAADGRNIDPASSGSTFDSAPRNATLTTFNGTNPNGNWTLFVADLAGGNTSTLNGYTVSVAAVPEPVQTGLVMGAVLGLTAIVLKKRKAPETH